MLEKSAKYFTVVKNGKTDTVSIDRLKPAFVLSNNNIEGSRAIVGRKEEQTVTQPREMESKNPETKKVSADKSEVSTETPEVAATPYRDALLRDAQDPGGNKSSKRSYIKRPPEQRLDAQETRSGRLSRPPVRL